MKKQKQELPPNVVEADKKYCEHSERVPYAEMSKLVGDDNFAGAFTFYKAKNLGWVLCTLHISNPSRRQAAGTTARTYAIGVKDQKICTVGRGPHVEAEVEIFLSKENLERLMPYVELYKKGLADALSIRDRISTRRAQGQLHRAAGRSSWMW